MYRVTLHHLSPDALSASPASDETDRGSLPGAELRTLLESFCRLDAVENAYAEPEIRIGHGRARYVVQTEHGRLLLYDARDRLAPAQLATPAEVLAELDGSAPAARAAAIAAARPQPLETVLPEAEPNRAPQAHPRRVACLAVVFGLSLLSLAFVSRGGQDPVTEGEPRQMLEAAELAATLPGLVGVFMTGGEPGQHGIALTDSGEVKLFRVNRLEAPSVVRDSFRLARRGARLELTIGGNGNRAEFIDRNTLLYCGETYRRIP